MLLTSSQLSVCVVVSACNPINKMLRRETRLRRGYLYRKSQEDRVRTIEEKKQKLKSALDGEDYNRLIPTEVCREAVQLQKLLEYDDEGAEGVSSHMDDEYKWAGVEDSKVMVTTSRDPSSRLKMFVKNVVMRHDVPDIGTMSEAYPNLIFHNFSSRLGQRVSNILKYLFPVPKEDSRRVITFANQEDFISFRHHTYKKTDHRNVELSEVGPRFEIKLYMIKLGTLENEATADVEWRHHSYTHTAKKRKFLSME
ncbi:U3 small nucleolar ribonucleoprotein protein IMP4-like [Oncorhynchus nerka]|uniref:U3 small nucleolar ribonucleoprotein protein IMP4-like n=1 Tax=Oncorhynchus nerka TaxID=8023 RepID=UPI0011304430|nr:U3 small nucleolar ribonucleoprotein protein IMP4-like [Oncorhynchus nerka]